MNKEILNIGTEFCSDTCYRFNGNILSVSVEETQRITDRKFFSLTSFNRGYLDTAFYLHNLKNVVLDFGGAVLYLKGRIQPFIIDECENITVKNVTIEYDRAFFSEFDVVSNENGELRLNQRKNFPCRVENGYLIPYSETWENRSLHIGDMFVQAFDRETREASGFTVAAIGEEIKLKETPPCYVHHLRVREENGNIILSGTFPEHWNSDHVIALSHETRDKTSAFICCSKNTVIENYRIINGAGYGIVSMYSENITIDGLILTCDERSHGIMTNSADAIHLVTTKGDIVIRNSVMENMFDDSLNIHGLYYVVSSKCDGGICAYKHKESYSCDAYYKNFGIGDTIRVYRGHTLEEKCTLSVMSVEVIDDHHVLLKTDGELTEICEDDLIENISTQPNILIEKCRFGKAISHLRIQSRGHVSIRDNEIGLPLMFTGDTTYWFEASPCEDVTIEHNRFVGDRGVVRICPEYKPTEATPYYHSGIRMINNVFDCDHPMSANNSCDITFADNTCSRSGAALHLKTVQCGGSLQFTGCIHSSE